MRAAEVNGVPQALARPCRAGRCKNLTLDASGLCPEHRRATAAAYDAERGNSHARGYTRRWRAYRLQVLEEHPLCACGAVAAEIDHIQAVSGPEDPLFWYPSNHEARCKSCHSRKTALRDRRWGR